jgi:hypothetical protein
MHQSARTPGYAGGGYVTWPFPTTAAMTRVPSKQEAMNAVIPAGPTGGGMTYKWIEALVASRFPGLHAISDFRPGAVTLSGNRSYHAIGRAVDFPPSHALAKFFHDNYMARLKELITPWNELNVWNGRPHRYTGAIWNQHNFAGGNAHDHVAMRTAASSRSRCSASARPGAPTRSPRTARSGSCRTTPQPPTAGARRRQHLPDHDQPDAARAPAGHRP